MVTQKPGGDTARAFTAMLDDIIQDAETMEKEDLQLSGGGVNTLKMGHHRYAKIRKDHEGLKRSMKLNPS